MRTELAGGVGGPATMGDPRSGSRASSEPALTSSACRCLSAIAPSAHTPEPAELFLFNRQPCRVTLPSPPPPASLRGGAGAAWKGHSCQFAPPALGTPGFAHHPPSGPWGAASPPLPALTPRGPAASSCKISHPAASRHWVWPWALPHPRVPPAHLFLPETHCHGSLDACSFPVSASSRAALHLMS